MFNGQQETVTLRFADKLIGPVLDKFGEDTKMTRVDDHTIEATVQVRIAPTFWGWMFQFGTDMLIVQPVELVLQYAEMAKAIITNLDTRALHLRDATYCCSLGQFVHVEQTG